MVMDSIHVEGLTYVALLVLGHQRRVHRPARGAIQCWVTLAQDVEDIPQPKPYTHFIGHVGEHTIW